jgi:hypothetical protein
MVAVNCGNRWRQFPISPAIALPSVRYNSVAEITAGQRVSVGLIDWAKDRRRKTVSGLGEIGPLQ